MDGDDDAEGGRAHSVAHVETSEKKPRERITISHADFQRMSSMLIRHVRLATDTVGVAADPNAGFYSGAPGGDAGEVADGVTRSELINWYLGEIEEEIRDEADLMHQREVVERVIAKLIRVRTFVHFQTEDETSGEIDQGEGKIMLHPNFVDDGLEGY